jgi:TrpR-related protein YerC/YecD
MYMGKIRHPGEDLFYEALLSLENAEQLRMFLEDICTIKELQSLFQRFRVACLLDAGSNYLETSDATGASSATISRVNRCLNYGTGYRKALDNLKKAGILDDDGCDSEA